MTVSRRVLLLRLAALPMPLLLGAACSTPQPSPTAIPAPATAAPPTAAPQTAALTQAPAVIAQPTQAPAVIAKPTQAPPAVAAPTQAAPTLVIAPPTAAAAGQPGALQPTPACADDDDPTPAQTEGPYFSRNSPERASLLEPGVNGTRIILSGYVYSTSCRPLDRALLDFWQADDAGAYDNSGFRYRGHQFTNAEGRFSLETVVPGLYPGRTRHLHVKVQAANQPVLTTQLYFPGEARNRTDGIYRAELEMQVQDAAAGVKAAAFNFVLNAG